MQRREFLRAMALAAGLVLVPIGRSGFAAATANANKKRLVVVFLRGAVDGLNIVVPYGDARYYDARPTLAIAKPGISAGVFDLDGNFGLHPALASLMPQWRNGSLAFIHACGSPDPSRSHFDAQDYMESGTPGVKNTPDGWMNRLLAVLPGPQQPTRAVSLGSTLPRILRGSMAVANLPTGRAAERPMPLDRQVVSNAFNRLYNGNDVLSRAYHEGELAHQQLLADLQQDMRTADNGAPTPIGFTNDTERLGALMAGSSGVQLAFLALGGWDTHVNQGAAQGQLANHLKPLSEGLAALATGLGPTYQDTVILVISEFGRTVRENGNAGTDHGHGNVMWVMGGAVQGGKVYGEWPGLAEENLYQGRDLAVTTDFRSAIGTVLAHHLRLDDRQLSGVFPEMPNARREIETIIKS